MSLFEKKEESIHINSIIKLNVSFFFIIIILDLEEKKNFF